MLLGVSKSGKDTTGEELVKNNYIRIAAADKAKQEFCEINNIPLEYLMVQGPLKEKYRGALIEYAEDKRKIDKCYWINKAFEPYLDNESVLKPGRYVITDFRRIDEIDWFYSMKEKGVDVKIILIERPGTIENDVLTLKTLARAAREAIIYDKIVNDSSLEDLKIKINNQIIKIKDNE